MNNILENNEFKIIKNIKSTKDKGLCSVTLFRLPNPYKKFKFLIKNLYNFINIIEELFPNVILRIYFGFTVLENIDNDKFEVNKLIKYIKEKSFTELIIFKNPKLIITQNGKKYHNGYYGNFIRLLPLFGKEKYKFVWVSNINLSKEMIQRYKPQIERFIKSKNNILYNSDLYYYKPWILFDCKYKITNKLVICKKPLDLSILNLFMKYNLYTVTNYILTDANKYFLKNKNIDWKQLIPYGSDEFFFNNNLLTHLDSKKITSNIIYDTNLINAINILIFYRDELEVNVQRKIDETFVKMRSMIGIKTSNLKKIITIMTNLNNQYLSKPDDNKIFEKLIKFYSELSTIFKEFNIPTTIIKNKEKNELLINAIVAIKQFNDYKPKLKSNFLITRKTNKYFFTDKEISERLT